jgi:hypothetical protein
MSDSHQMASAGTLSHRVILEAISKVIFEVLQSQQLPLLDVECVSVLDPVKPQTATTIQLCSISTSH